MLKRILLLIFLILWAAPLFAQSVDTAWVRRYNGPGHFNELPYSLVVDQHGNVYVTGRSAPVTGTPWNYDYATVKYYPNGDTAWVRRYGTTSLNADIPRAVVVDSSGNVIVAGNVGTIKYDINGNQLWIGQWGGIDVATDAYMNIYVTGACRTDSTSQDYTTIKYYPNGDTAWVRRYDGPPHDTDSPVALAVDRNGNVCITGFSFGFSSDRDYATVKYYASGEFAWARRYNGPGNSWDYPVDIAIDDSGCIYITGDSDGDSTYFDCATIKYLPNGDISWLIRYNGPGNTWDEVSAIAIDKLNNIYVTGSLGTIKYDTNGNQLWKRAYGGLYIALDPCDNIYIVQKSGGAGTSADYLTIRYSPNGDTCWTRRYNGPGNGGDYPYGIGVDSSGGVFVTGRSLGFGTSYDYGTVKYVQFVRADANRTGVVNILDIVYLINFLLRDGPDPIPAPVVGDADNNSKVDLDDILYLINYLFKSGPAPSI